ncbi:hypothetical protein C0J52_05876 [Blattella germanica]|nr:hypothetical protein C0J52_05876 [Blattella germanica]
MEGQGHGDVWNNYELRISRNVRRFIADTGYVFIQQRGQRLTRIPLNIEVSQLPDAYTLYFYDIPGDCFEDELVPFFQIVGDVYELILLINPSGFNSGCGYVKYPTPQSAEAAVQLLNNFEFRTGLKMSIVKCNPNQQFLDQATNSGNRAWGTEMHYASDTIQSQTDVDNKAEAADFSPRVIHEVPNYPTNESGITSREATNVGGVVGSSSFLQAEYELPSTSTCDSPCALSKDDMPHNIIGTSPSEDELMTTLGSGYTEDFPGIFQTSLEYCFEEGLTEECFRENCEQPAFIKCAHCVNCICLDHAVIVDLHISASDSVVSSGFTEDFPGMFPNPLEYCFEEGLMEDCSRENCEQPVSSNMHTA